MTPDEIYQRAEQATHGIADAADPQATLSSFSPENEEPDWHAAIESAVTAVAPSISDAATFRGLVARVTEVLADEMELPTFEEWSAAYSEAPEEFDSDMLGFWKDELK
jgi:hypothetical protein